MTDFKTQALSLSDALSQIESESRAFARSHSFSEWQKYNSERESEKASLRRALALAQLNILKEYTETLTRSLSLTGSLSESDSQILSEARALALSVSKKLY